jgi:UDP-N-acetylmuramoylalanine--D-glutamate ligase
MTSSLIDPSFRRSHPSGSLHGQRWLVLGFGRQGRALARWLPRQGASVVVIDGQTAAALGVDEAVLGAEYPGVRFIFGGPAAADPALLDGAAAVCLSGGVSPEHALAAEARARGLRITNDAQLLLERCPAHTLGITGSAGKTTTTTLVGRMLETAGFTTWVGGNIGRVLLDDLDAIAADDVAVLELSSFQLELMTVSTEIAAVLNITPNHLDRHGTMQAYTEAKARIITGQGRSGLVVLSRDDAGSRDLAPRVGERREPGGVAWFSVGDGMVPDGAFMAGRRLMVTGRSTPDGGVHTVCEREALRLRGEHNLANALAACAIAGAAGVPADAMREVLHTFGGVEHRLEVVAVREGVLYINDSIATAPERVMAALKSFHEPIVLLLGGRDKKLPWEDMLRLAQARCRAVVVFGEAAPQIEAAYQAAAQGAVPPLVRAAALDDAVSRARGLARPGDVVLLSPGATSYDAYRDFAERGEHFRRLVNA